MCEADQSHSVADVEGPWVDPNFDSGLISRLKRNWSVPVHLLSNEALATFIRQRIGLQLVVPEARERIKRGFEDDSELFDGELKIVLSDFDSSV